MFAKSLTRAGGRGSAGTILLFLVLLAGCAAPGERYTQGQEIVGVASWYGGKFHGRRTASGAIFDQNGHTAAHRTLPFGTRVQVTNLENGRSLVVVITDRGPFVRDRVIDVSRRVAERLGFRRKGLARVRLQIVNLAHG